MMSDLNMKNASKIVMALAAVAVLIAAEGLFVMYVFNSLLDVTGIGKIALWDGVVLAGAANIWLNFSLWIKGKARNG